MKKPTRLKTTTITPLVNPTLKVLITAPNTRSMSNTASKITRPAAMIVRLLLEIMKLLIFAQHFFGTYSEMPKLKPLGMREPALAPNIPRLWTEKGPVKKCCIFFHREKYSFDIINNLLLVNEWVRVMSCSCSFGTPITKWRLKKIASAILLCKQDGI